MEGGEGIRSCSAESMFDMPGGGGGGGVDRKWICLGRRGLDPQALSKSTLFCAHACRSERDCGGFTFSSSAMDATNSIGSDWTKTAFWAAPTKQWPAAI